jgi:hypothetical protein
MDNDLSGSILDSLNEEQQRELLLAYEESFDEASLLNHIEVKLQHEKWLKVDQ